MSTRGKLLGSLLLLGFGIGCSSASGPDAARESAVAEAGPSAAESAEAATEPAAGLLLPAVAREEAPAQFQVRFRTTQGEVIVQSQRAWAPIGCDRLYNLVRVGYFREVAFYRAIEHFIIQFGVHSDPEINRLWADAPIRDDPPHRSNQRGTLAFAQEGANSRTTQLFFNLADNGELDGEGFVPVAEIVEGQEVVDALYTGYGEIYPKGQGPRPFLLGRLGNTYLKRQFPQLDYILEAQIVE